MDRLDGILPGLGSIFKCRVLQVDLRRQLQFIVFHRILWWNCALQACQWHAVQPKRTYHEFNVVEGFHVV